MDYYKLDITSHTIKKVRWNKVKGASGYIVKETYSMFLGYNIYGYPVYDSGIKSKISVTAYTKHDSLYFVEGNYIISNKYTYS